MYLEYMTDGASSSPTRQSRYRRNIDRPLTMGSYNCRAVR